MADAFRYSLGNLARQKLRTFLTVFGVIVGTGAIVLMVSLGIGLQEQTISFFNKVDILTTVTVFPQKRSTSFMSFGKPVGGAPMKLDDAVIEEFKAIPGVQAVFPNLNLNGRLMIDKVEDGKKKTVNGGFIVYLGLPQDALTPLYRDALLAGNYWSEENPAEHCAVVPADTLYDMGLGPPLAGKQKPGETPAAKGDPRWKDVLGLEVKIQFNMAVAKGEPPAKGEDEKDPEGGPKDPGEDPETVTKRVTKRFKIIGVYDSANIGNPFVPAVFVPLEQGKELMKMRGTRGGTAEPGYQQVMVKVKDASRTDEIRRELDARGYGTLTFQDVVEVIGYVFVTLKAVLGAVASIGLIVAFFGIANTMIMAILERTREIGIMKALGARNSEIRRLFIVEAAAIGGLGALFGIGGGWAIGKGFNLVTAWFVVKRGGPENVHLFSVSPWLAGGTLTFAIFVAVIAGLYPAWRASRLDPVAALRSL
ncbi:MAG: ABC transporter permease [Planctomycetes bacterium]|nr:ABC transporter permease [Planctomycetota bacterium]